MEGTAFSGGKAAAVFFRVGLLIGVLSVGGFAQMGEVDPPVLRVSSYNVVVDVVVTDKGNRTVADLTEKDFLVLEDGIAQSIESFQSIHSGAIPAGRASRNRLHSDLALGTPRSPNLVILLLDYATVEYGNQGYIREAVRHYILEEMQPSDLMAVFRVGMSLQFVQGFTNDRKRLIEAVWKMDPAGTAYAGDQAFLDDSAQNAQAQVDLLTSNIDSLSNGIGNAAPGVASVVEQLGRQLDMAQALEGRYYAQLSYSRDQQSRPIIGAVETIARGVSHIPGRKTLILFSEGFSVPLTLESALYRAVDAANKSNLAVYAIDGGGLRVKQASREGELNDISAGRGGDRVRAYGGLSQFDRAREIGSDQKEATLRYISTATGGSFLHNTNDLLGAMERVDQDIRSHYVLTYRPLNRNFEGEFREIRVKIGRPHLRVRTRAGYFAVPPGASLLSVEEFKALVGPQAPKRTTAEESMPLFSQLSYFLADARQYRVHLSLEIPLKGLPVHSVGGERFVDLRVVGLVRDDSGEVVTSFRGPSRFQLSEEVQKASKTVRLQNQLLLTAGRYSVTLGVLDSDGGIRVIQHRGLRLPSIGTGMSLSNLVVGKSEQLVRASSEGDLTVDGVHVTPSIDRTFQNGDQMVYLVHIYNPMLDQRAAPDLEYELTLYRKDRKISQERQSVATHRLEPGVPPHVRLARALKLKDFQPGSYFLRLSVRDRLSDQVSHTQTVFHIVR
ncbi:MAG: VWA domain-containing protein [Acidobacteriota bacterium]